MPKLISLDPLQTKQFKVVVKKVRYNMFESTSKFAPPIVWIANCNCLIVKPGRGKNKSFCAVQLYLTEQEYNDKVVEKNDIVLLSDKVSWEVKKGVAFRTYGEEKLKDVDTKNIMFDQNGKPYAEDYVYPYVIKAKQDTWKIFEKNDEYFISNVGNTSKIQLIFDSKEEMVGFTSGKFSIDNEEYQKLENDNHKFVSFVGYSHKQKCCNKNMLLTLEFDKDIDKWIMDIKEVNI